MRLSTLNQELFTYSYTIPFRLLSLAQLSFVSYSNLTHSGLKVFGVWGVFSKTPHKPSLNIDKSSLGRFGNCFANAAFGRFSFGTASVNTVIGLILQLLRCMCKPSQVLDTDKYRLYMYRYLVLRTLYPNLQQRKRMGCR